MGALGWTPTEFWGATPSDLVAASSGWRKVRGIDNSDDLSPNELVAAYDEMIGIEHGR